MLKRSVRSVLIEKGVTAVRWLPEDLESLGHESLDTLDERNSVKVHWVWLRQIYNLMTHAVHGKVPVPELPNNDGRVQQQLNR
jgi:hypothetical protein